MYKVARWTLRYDDLMVPELCRNASLLKRPPEDLKNILVRASDFTFSGVAIVNAREHQHEP